MPEERKKSDASSGSRTACMEWKKPFVREEIVICLSCFNGDKDTIMKIRETIRKTAAALKREGSQRGKE